MRVERRVVRRRVEVRERWELVGWTFGVGCYEVRLVVILLP